jgi:alanyl-tRNA synthetase
MFSGIKACLLNLKDNAGQWALVSTGEEPLDFRHFRDELLPLLKGKGGGKSPLWQGKLENCSSLDEFCEKFSLSLT